MRTLLLLALCAGPAFLVSCEKKPQAVEKPTATLANRETARLGMAVDAFVASPTDTQAASVEKAFAELDGEIAELDRRVTKTSGAEQDEARAKAVQLHTYRDKEMARFTEAKLRVKTQTEKASTGAKVEAAADKLGDGVKEAVETVKEKIP